MKDDVGAATHDVLDLRAASPERFEPDADGGKLVHAEHVVRYLWAADLAGGREILDAGCGTGYGSMLLAEAGARRLVSIDVSAEAVAQTKARIGEQGEVIQTDARELPFPDDTFDLIVCFEVIEHIEGANRALAEFARTLRPDGILLISSPNPRLYLPGNPHHVHEFVPEELQAALEQHFSQVKLAAQRALLGSLISDQDQLQRLMVAVEKPISAILPEMDATAEGTYVLAVAAQVDAEFPDPRIAFGEAFEVSWWMERVTEVEQRLSEAIRERELVSARADETDARLAALEARLVEVEQERARLLSERPRFEQAVAELERARRVMTDLQESISWKLTTPLRSGKQLARRGRRPRQ